MAGNDRFVVGRIVELGDCTDAEKEQRLAKALKDATITSTSANCFDSESILKEADAILHRLWTWAVGMEGYDKAEWKRLEALIWKLGRPGETVNPKAEEDDDEEVVDDLGPTTRKIRAHIGHHCHDCIFVQTVGPADVREQFSHGERHVVRGQ